MRKAYLLIDNNPVRVKFKQDSPGQYPETNPALTDNPTMYSVWHDNAWQRVYEHDSLSGKFYFIKPDTRIRIIDE